MSHDEQTRSTLKIDAVAQAAAESAATALSPSKRNAIAGLAGLVLRLFRSQERFPLRTGRARRSLEPISNQTRSRVEGESGRGITPRPDRKGGVAAAKGGIGHGHR